MQVVLSFPHKSSCRTKSWWATFTETSPLLRLSLSLQASYHRIMRCTSSSARVLKHAWLWKNDGSDCSFLDFAALPEPTTGCCCRSKPTAAACWFLRSPGDEEWPIGFGRLCSASLPNTKTIKWLTQSIMSDKNSQNIHISWTENIKQRKRWFAGHNGWAFYCWIIFGVNKQIKAPVQASCLCWSTPPPTSPPQKKHLQVLNSIQRADR